MRILFVHQNFPGQFRHLAPALAREGHTVVATCSRRNVPENWCGVRVLQYAPQRGSAEGVHPWVKDLETKVVRAEALFRMALELKAQGFVPDLVVAHHGWGESLFLKDVWPDARLGIYCEFFYHASGADTGFDPEFTQPDPTSASRVRLRNVNNLLHFEQADAGISPTAWQASTFPEPFRSRIAVIHDGIDTTALRPDPAARVSIRAHTIGEQAGAHPPARSIELGRDDEVVTFVNRNLEPYRGYHIFMRALPALLRERPAARVVIVGSDGVSYGGHPADGRRWKDVFLDEVRPAIAPADRCRVLFTGHLAYPDFVRLMQTTRVHVYLTYPFVLSWSLLEAMSVGAAIVASDTPPVGEAIVDGQTGCLVPFFDPAALAQRVCELLDDAGARARLGRAAREGAMARYDLHQHCLPAQRAWIRSLAG